MASLDMSLDDMIKTRRNTERGRGQGRPRGGRGGSFRGGRMSGGSRRGGGGGGRGGPLRVNTTRPSTQIIAKSIRRTKGLPWHRDLVQESFRAVGLPDIENGAKLFVSNLDSGVSNEDIRELFAEIGELKQYAIYFDKNGRPTGSADVVFARRSDAFQAMKRYNNVQLDGKPMKIEIVGAKSEIPVSVSARVNVVGGVNGRRTVVMTPGMGHGVRGRGAAAVNRIYGQRSRGGIMNGSGRGSRGRGRGNFRGRGHGRGGGRGGKKNVDKSADQLDKDLESYHVESMQT